MRVVIAGGGSVGTSIALDLADRGHDITLLEQVTATAERLRTQLPGVQVIAADACEFSTLASVDLRSADVVIAATGDDEDNLVVSWLSKQEFGVPRVIARINNARNSWLFNANWGVDVSVSTPALITSLVDEAVETDFARLQSLVDAIRKSVSNVINWRNVLRQFVGSITRGGRATSIKRINKRYPYIHPGVKRGYEAKLLVAIDQSGSVDNEMLVEFFGMLLCAKPK